MVLAISSTEIACGLDTCSCAVSLWNGPKTARIGTLSLRGQHKRNNSKVGLSAAIRCCVIAGTAVFTRWPTSCCAPPYPQRSKTGAHRMPCSAGFNAVYMQSKNSWMFKSDFRNCIRMCWYDLRTKHFNLQNPFTSNGCSNHVSLADTTNGQMPNAWQYESTLGTRWTLQASNIKIGWYLSKYGSSASASCRNSSLHNLSLFHALFWRVSLMLAGQRARSMPNCLAGSVFSLPIKC